MHNINGPAYRNRGRLVDDDQIIVHVNQTNLLRRNGNFVPVEKKINRFSIEVVTLHNIKTIQLTDSNRKKVFLVFEGNWFIDLGYSTSQKNEVGNRLEKKLLLF